MQTLLALAVSGRADPVIVRSLQLARDGRGRKGNGLPSIRTLKRWLSAGDLTPRVAQRDMSVPPWAKVFLERYQQPQKPSIEAAYRDACNAWPAAERPSIHQVRRFLDKLGTVTRERGRMGPRELKNIRPFIRRGFEHLEPNDIWSADGHERRDRTGLRRHPRHRPVAGNQDGTRAFSRLARDGGGSAQRDARGARRCHSAPAMKAETAASMETNMDEPAMKALYLTWEQRARSKFLSAEHEENAMGRRLIEHGAMCYFNCARELREALEAPSPPTPAPLSGDRT